jgi:hypothetical protein
VAWSIGTSCPGNAREGSITSFQDADIMA